MTNKNDVIAALPYLTNADLQELRAVIDQLLGSQQLAAEEESASEQAMLIFDALRGAVGSAIPFTQLPAGAQKSFNTKLIMIQKYFNNSFEGWDDQKISQLAFLKQMFALLQKDIFSISGHKPTTMMMIQNMHRLPEVINASFPGYLTSELGQLILKQFIRK